MLTLTMRREDRTNKVPVTTTSEEFVDILQVQQLLLNETRREQAAHAAQASSSSLHVPQVRAGEVAGSGYYYGGYQTIPGPATSASTSASVDELVAMWFSGSQASEKPEVSHDVTEQLNPSLVFQTEQNYSDISLNSEDKGEWNFSSNPNNVTDLFDRPDT